jgi:hypothetical protein
MPPRPVPRATSASAAARMVPEAPNAISHSVRLNRDMTGSISSCTSVRARFMRFSVITPSPKWRALRLTHPM